MLFLISGAAASGKKSVVRILSGKLENCECHDFNETPVPDGTSRRKVLEKWVQRAIVAQERGDDFLISAQSPFGELLACPSTIKLDGISCCFLDCDDYVRVERYLARPQFVEWPLGMDTLCWAVFHRMHAKNPQWEQRVIVDENLPEFCWERWINWKADDKRWNVKIIDTTKNEVNFTANLVHNWIKSEQVKEQELRPEKKWWK